jgi:hypothetical protein
MNTSNTTTTTIPLYILYITSMFIMIRSIVRVAELVKGCERMILMHGVYLYIFDSVSMTVVMIIFDFGTRQTSLRMQERLWLI